MKIHFYFATFMILKSDSVASYCSKEPFSACCSNLRPFSLARWSMHMKVDCSETFFGSRLRRE